MDTTILLELGLHAFLGDNRFPIAELVDINTVGPDVWLIFDSDPRSLGKCFSSCYSHFFSACPNTFGNRVSLVCFSCY